MARDVAVACQVLPWDSEFFGLRIGRLAAHRLRPEQMTWLLGWCRENRIDCLYFLADAADVASVQLVEAARFRLVDVRVVLDRPLDDLPASNDPGLAGDIRSYQATDLDDLRAIARSSFAMTRFYRDGRFPKPKCDRLYEIWVERACQAAPTRALVAQTSDGPVGFITWQVTADRAGSISLIGVKGTAAGSGTGGALVAAAVRRMSAEAISVEVATQGANVAAQRMYQRTGFRTRAVGLWYHLWLDEAS